MWHKGDHVVIFLRNCIALEFDLEYYNVNINPCSPISLQNKSLYVVMLVNWKMTIKYIYMESKSEAILSMQCEVTMSLV